MIDKDEIQKRRNGAIAARLDIKPDDRIFEMISRHDGLHIVTFEKIIRVNLPNETDPEIEFSDAPITQTLIANAGSRNAIIARTILQSKDFANLYTATETRQRIQDIAWVVMQSLLAVDRAIDLIQQSISKNEKEIEAEFEKYIVGDSPSPPPIVEGVEADFRSAVLLANIALDEISELFLLILEAPIKRGRYDKLIAWSERTFGENDILTWMLKGDHRWINLWNEVRNAFDLPLNFHPAAIRVSVGFTPSGAGGATWDRRSWSGLRSRSHVAVRLAA